MFFLTKRAWGLRFGLRGTATLPHFFLRCATLTPLSPPSYHRHCGLDPQSPIHRQGSYISTNVSPQSIRGFFFLFVLRGRGLRVKPAMTNKGGDGRCMVRVRNGEQRGRGGVAG
ncbi:MAG: hypothetical protein ACRC3G_00820 [Bacteroidales bacterium]